MTNKLLALLLPAALTIAQIAEAKKPRQIPDWYPDKDSLYRAVESIPPFGIYKDNYIFPRGEIYDLLTTRPEDMKNETKNE